MSGFHCRILAVVLSHIQRPTFLNSHLQAKKEKGEINDVEFMDDDDEGTSMSLADRIGGSPAGTAGPVKKEKKPSKHTSS